MGLFSLLRQLSAGFSEHFFDFANPPARRQRHMTKSSCRWIARRRSGTYHGQYKRNEHLQPRLSHNIGISRQSILNKSFLSLTMVTSPSKIGPTSAKSASMWFLSALALAFIVSMTGDDSEAATVHNSSGNKTRGLLVPPHAGRQARVIYLTLLSGYSDAEGCSARSDGCPYRLLKVRRRNHAARAQRICT